MNMLKKKVFLMLNLTETWLNETIKDDADLEGYKIYRGDRKSRIRGGTAIYLHDKLEAEEICQMSYENCEMIALSIPDMQTINIVVYRPPGTELKVFEVILKKIEENFQNLQKPDPTIILSGDLNFPFVKWNRQPEGGCDWKYKANTNATRNEKIQFEKLMEICNEKCMLQIIEEGTRNENTLDLMFTNEVRLITNVDVNTTSISDHKRIEVSTNFLLNDNQNKYNTNNNTNDLKSLNFNAKQIDWEKIKEGILKVKWEELCNERETFEIVEELLTTFKTLSHENIPKKKNNGRNRGIPKEIRKLLNRIKMLKRNKQKATCVEKKKIIENEICKTEEELIKTKRKMKLDSESRAINCMKKNPKMLYAIVNKQKKTEKIK